MKKKSVSLAQQQEQQIVLKNVTVHNLKGVDLTLNPNQLIIFTGVSGSGKTSLAFDTIYVEGQRRYIESLSAQARRHMGDFPKPEADLITGLSPTIAIEQKTSGRNPRSTVGTMTGIYDFLRVLYARIGTAYCPESGERVVAQSLEQILNQLLAEKEGSKWIIYAPFARGKKGKFIDEFNELLRKGFSKARLDGKLLDLSEEPEIDGKIAHDLDLLVDRVVVKKENRNRLADSLSSALDLGDGTLILHNVETGEERLCSQHAHSKSSGKSYPALEPHDFSFNHPSGMCPGCHGLGVAQAFDLEKIIDPEKSIAQDCCAVASSYTTIRYGNIYDNLAAIAKFDINTPWKELPVRAKNLFLHGNNQKWTKMHFVHPITRSEHTEYVSWKGVLYEARKKYEEAKSDLYKKSIEKLMHSERCPECNGGRLKAYPAATKLGDKTIHELTNLSLLQCYDFLKGLPLTENDQLIGQELLKEAIERLRFLLDVGLHYLTLERTSPTLSGGEAQRVRLASQIGSGLVGATYVLDEPSIGLHPRDNTRLLKTLEALRDMGNTVIVIEHDEETIAAADYVVDVGPYAGSAGGKIVAQGTIEDILKSKESITGQFLARTERIEIPKKRRKIGKEGISIEGASHHNLKGISAFIPLGVFVAVTGVSGSGKSSLISEILFPALSCHLHKAEMPVGKHTSLLGTEYIDKVIAIDQSPIGRTPRSNPATYCDLSNPIRDLFSQLPDSVVKGFTSGRFSFNVKEGSCPHCSGMGMTKLDMDFMEDEWIVCEFCKGRRFDAQTLSVLYKGKNIYDVLEMTIIEAAAFFENVPPIRKKLETLLEVGLGYLKLGQPSPTLSGGEAQRIKLAKELSRPSTGKTLYILDEPTTGLHFYDIKKLIAILQALVDKGNTVLVIEHNMDCVKTADHIIDLGPEGGAFGGEIVATGTPEAVAKMETPTGLAIRAALNPPDLRSQPKRVASEVKKQEIAIRGARQNNLQGFDLNIPRGQITVCTGPSGSGKSSLAFETVYAEGQRRYTESMSPYARQFIKQMAKPKVESIDGLSPAIAIEQKQHAGNPRSTIGTMTESYDFLRVIYAHLGTPHCPETGEPLQIVTADDVVKKLMSLPPRAKLYILAPLVLHKNESFGQLKERLLREGFLRIRVGGKYHELEDEITFDKKATLELVVDTLMVLPDSTNRMLEAIENAIKVSNGTLTAHILGGEELSFRIGFVAPSTGKSYPPITPHTFSFNTDRGMCMECLGLGFQYGANLESLPHVQSCTTVELLEALWKEQFTRDAAQACMSLLRAEGIDLKIPIELLSESQQSILFHGSKSSFQDEKSGLILRFIGINELLAKSARSAVTPIRSAIIPLMHESLCHSCKGSRLSPLARHVKLSGLSLSELCALPIGKAAEFLQNLSIPKEKQQLLKEPLEQLGLRLSFINKIGLHYLSLDRSAPTLSNGEAQRIQLARQLGTKLTGCLYVLDEPTTGLHPHNNAQLAHSLQELKELGNTLLLVEHDPITVEAADYIIDFGPGSGKFGGQVIAKGTPEQIKQNPNSLTGLYLSGKKRIPLPKSRRKVTETISIKKARLHNLKDLTVKIPLGIFTAVTGVSGSGKSTLIHDLLKPALQQHLIRRRDRPKEITLRGATISNLEGFSGLIALDQNPIGHTNRATVASYSDLLTHLRELYAQHPEAIARGLKPKHFSSNHLRGMCKECFGLGKKSIELQFLPPVEIVCPSCKGFRLNAVSLLVDYKGYHLGKALQFDVKAARAFFENIPKVVQILDTLIAVGLDYLQLDLPMASLSGGEQQRIRLARELAKSTRGKTIYLLDEPTVGLHSEDISKLIPIFHSLVSKGHTVIIIEHNLDVIANSDYIIDLGPEAGLDGGNIVAMGTPEQLAKNKHSHTAKYLADYLAAAKA